jgi:hypothetical protein
VNYLLTVNKATGSVVLQANSGSVRAGQSTTITVSSSHGGVLTAAATSGSTNRVPTITGPTNNQFTVFTNGTTGTTVTITVTCAADVHYNAASATYTLTILPTYDIKMNPLYYVSERYVISATEFASQDNAGYFFTWTDAMANFAAQTTTYNTYKTANKSMVGSSDKWHLPTEKEWLGIVPGQNNVNIFEFTTAGNAIYKPTYVTAVWGYNTTTKAGVSESSYWKKISDREIHAIRFLGTEYCSAWKYELIGDFTSSSYGYMRISATLIEQVANNSESAENWYNNKFSVVTWGNNSEDGAAQRVFYARGYRTSGSGSGSAANLYQGAYGYGWSTTENPDNSAIVWALVFCGGSTYQWHAQIHSQSFGKGYAWGVRLFRDN